ncbi:MAG: hypothetical protein JW810_10450 [Sedimentisphaerales bacterium]|nr:hypothetical protein [Sedimentisphaerales bacterium]
MRTLFVWIAMGSLLFLPAQAAPPAGETYATVPPAVRFVPVHVTVDSADKALAAYQFELKAVRGDVTIVGVEGGQAAAFRAAPYYDAAALHRENRIIVAAFNTGGDLPQGKTRVATVHLLIRGDAEPQYELSLAVAADAEGTKIPNAEIRLETGDVK